MGSRKKRVVFLCMPAVGEEGKKVSVKSGSLTIIYFSFWVKVVFQSILTENCTFGSIFDSISQYDILVFYSNRELFL